MAKVKNVSYMEIQALLEDGKSVMRFMPGDVKEVDESEVFRMCEERYPGVLVKEEDAPKPIADESLVDPNASEDEQAVSKNTCMVCGFTAKSQLGLTSHMRKHEREGKVE